MPKLKFARMGSVYLDLVPTYARRPYRQRKEKTYKVTEPKKVKRSCLKCDEPFTADGKFNRICSDCTRENKYTKETHTEEALFYGGNSLNNNERYLMRAIGKRGW